MKALLQAALVGPVPMTPETRFPSVTPLYDGLERYLSYMLDRPASRMQVLLMWMDGGRRLSAVTDSVTGHRPGEIV